MAGRHYLTKGEINALYFATHQMGRPRAWDAPFAVGRYWRSALVLFFNYHLDTGTVWKSAPFHEPILCRTCPGVGNHQTVKLRNNHRGGGCSTAG